MITKHEWIVYLTGGLELSERHVAPWELLEKTPNMLIIFMVLFMFVLWLMFGIRD